MSGPFVEMVERVGRESEPRRALHQLLEGCITLTGASTGRIYLLDLAHSTYAKLDPPGAAGLPSCGISLLDADAHADGLPDDPRLRGVIRSRAKDRVARVDRQPMCRPDGPPAASRLLVPIVRDRSCLGVIDLDSEAPGHFTPDHEELVEVAAAFALLLCEKEDTMRLLRELPRPIDYHRAFGDFLDDLILLVADASGMPFLILREFDAEARTLNCLKSYGFEEVRDEELVLAPVEDFPTFRKALDGRETVVERDMDQPHVRQLLENLRMKWVRSFVVVPVCVGTDVFGTLSFAVACEHDYTALELGGLETIANAVGVAISNYRNVHAAESKLFEEAKIGAAITTVDVAQSARHEARNHLQNSVELLLLARGALARPRERDQVGKYIGELDQELKDIENALQKIKTVTKPPEREKKVERVDDLWRQAFGLVTGRLDTLKIRHAVKGTARAKVAPDFLRHAFLNLILNSVDAFKDSKKQGRAIEVVIDVQGDKAKEMLIRYVDNATGIDPSKLKHIPDAGSGTAADVFLAGVTSKEDGSGYGLYLVRKILADHNGSIDLLDHRNGIVFQIKLPKPATA